MILHTTLRWRHAQRCSCGAGIPLWLVKAGVVVDFISETVLVGFKCGVALYFASTQLPKLFGFKGAHGDFWERSGHFFSHLGETNLFALAVGASALVLLVLGKRFLKHKPVALFVVILSIVVASTDGLRRPGGADAGRSAAGTATDRVAGGAASSN